MLKPTLVILDGQSQVSLVPSVVSEGIVILPIGHGALGVSCVMKVVDERWISVHL